MTARIDFNGTSGLAPAQQGASFNVLMTYKDSLGALVDLTGYTAAMQVRKTYQDVTPILAITDTPDIAKGQITLGGALGTIRVEFVPDYLSTVPVPNGDARRTVPPMALFVHDLELTLPDGVTKERFMEGIFGVTAEVTK
jgi:hypothetical protein